MQGELTQPRSLWYPDVSAKGEQKTPGCFLVGVLDTVKVSVSFQGLLSLQRQLCLAPRRHPAPLAPNLCFLLQLFRKICSSLRAGSGRVTGYCHKPRHPLLKESLKLGRDSNVRGEKHSCRGLGSPGRVTWFHIRRRSCLRLPWSTKVGSQQVNQQL